MNLQTMLDNMNQVTLEEVEMQITHRISNHGGHLFNTVQKQEIGFMMQDFDKAKGWRKGFCQQVIDMYNTRGLSHIIFRPASSRV